MEISKRKPEAVWYKNLINSTRIKQFTQEALWNYWPKKKLEKKD